MRLLSRIFEQRVRGIRLIELVGFAIALTMVLWVCLSKARESDDVRQINELDARIAKESEAVQALKTKVAELEKPARLEAMAREYLDMKPVVAAHEAGIESLGEISRSTSRPVTAVVSAATTSASAASSATGHHDEDSLVMVTKSGDH